MSDNLRAKTIKALSWSFLQSAVARAIQFVIGIILARLLLPEQFGLIGMLMVFLAVARSFVESGFGSALIQKREATATDICSVFYFNTFVGILAAAFFCITAPCIATFFNQPILTPLMRVLSVKIVIDSFGSVQYNLLIREMDFRAHTIASVVAGLLSGIVGISMAVAGFGVWSLAAQQISASAFSTLCFWVLRPWRPALTFSFGSLRTMFAFGSRLLFSGLLNQVFENIHSLVIGKLFSAADLGLFTRAKALQELPAQTVSEVVGKVTFPVFSKSQGDLERLKKGAKKALSAVAFVNFPLLVGISVSARPLVIVLLGEKWAGSIPYLQLLCGLGLLYPIYLIDLNLLMSTGRSDLFLRLEIIKKALTVVSIIITYRWGISAMICGMIALSLIACYFSIRYIQIVVDYRQGEQLRDLIPYFVMAALMGIAASSVGLFGLSNHLMILFVQALIAIFVYTTLCWIFKPTAFVEIRCELRDRIFYLRGKQPLIGLASKE